VDRPINEHHRHEQRQGRKGTAVWRGDIQEWQVQLTPVTFWDDWTTRVEMGLDHAAMTQGVVREANLQDFLEYMQALPPEMAEKFIGH
jgi:hypothetical protein